MMKFLQGLAIAVVCVVVAVAVFLFAMRFADGPMAIVPGGAFSSGEPAPVPEDWSFLAERMEVEFQTMEPATSRTVWVGVHDRRLFLISGYMSSWYGGIWKQWPHYLGDNANIVLRVDGKLYDLRLERVMDGPDVIPVLSEFGRKYGGAAPDFAAPAEVVTSGAVWMYEAMAR